MTLVRAADPRPAALCRNRLACFLARRGVLSGWKDLEQPRYAALFSEDAEVAPELSRFLNRFKVIVSMLGPPSGTCCGILRRLSSAIVYGVDPRARARRTLGRHILDQWLEDLAEQGLTLPRERVWSGETLFQPKRPPTPRSVIIHPGSGGRCKCWSIDAYERLADTLQRADWRVRYMVGPDELERQGDDLLQRLSRSAEVIYKEDVCDAAGCLERVTVFVGNDAGMTHVAAAAGLKCVVLFRSTDPVVWRPPWPAVTVIDARDGAPSEEAILREIVQAVTVAC